MRRLLVSSLALLLATGSALAQSSSTESQPITSATTEEQLDNSLAANVSEEEEDHYTPIQLALESALENLPRGSEVERDRADAIAEWYEERNFEPIWVSNTRPSVKAENVVFKLMTAYEDGLNAPDYHGGELFSRMGASTVDELVDLELAITSASVRYGQHLNAGRVRPHDVNKELVVFPDEIAPGKLLAELEASKKPTRVLTDLAPNTDRYDRLRKHLLALKVKEAKGGWPSIPEGEVLKEGMEDPRVPALRERLIISGDMPRKAHQGSVYDGNLVLGMKRFQWRNGLLVDGVIGPETLKILNITIEERIKQVEINLERRRWMQADFGNTYIFVNLADQVLKMVKDGKTVHAELVQVGKPYHRTPVFNDEMAYLEFNPYWNVPYSIATKEYLPKLKKNPSALSKQNIRVLRNGKVVSASSVPWNSYSRSRFPVRLRQDPGPKNALGRVKFMFPNKFSIYIHDTPSKSKFNTDARFFSHGCIRLKNPFDLAEKILALQGIDRAKINALAGTGKRQIVRLKKKIPVHLAYLTAWVNKDGSVHYRRDIYGRDKILAEALGADS